LGHWLFSLSSLGITQLSFLQSTLKIGIALPMTDSPIVLGNKEEKEEYKIV
jgi:hypothetical protein